MLPRTSALTGVLGELSCKALGPNVSFKTRRTTCHFIPSPKHIPAAEQQDITPAKVQQVPGWAYGVVSGLSAMMVAWILVLPGTWRSGVWPEHADWLDSIASVRSGPVPNDVLSKYKGQTAVVLLHQLPCAVWAAAIPMQLSASLRMKAPSAHRWLGRTTAASTLAMSAGVLLMFWKGMAADITYLNVVLPAVTCWFIYTLVVAIFAAREKQYTEHRKWMLRHVAAGIWVAVQRLLLGALGIVGQLGYDWDAAGEQARVQAFGACSAVAIIICCSAVEVLLLSEQRPAKNAKSS